MGLTVLGREHQAPREVLQQRHGRARHVCRQSGPHRGGPEQLARGVVGRAPVGRTRGPKRSQPEGEKMKVMSVSRPVTMR